MARTIKKNTTTTTTNTTTTKGVNLSMENTVVNTIMDTIAALTDRVLVLEADNKALKARLAALEVAANGIDIPHTEEPVAEATTTTDTTENKPAPKTRRKKAAATTEKKPETTTEEVEVTPENTIDYNTMPFDELRAFAASFDIKGRSRAIIIEKLNAKNIVLVDGEKTATKAAEEATKKAEKKADIKPANTDTATMIGKFMKAHKYSDLRTLYKKTRNVAKADAMAEEFFNDAIKDLGWCRAIKMLKDHYGVTGNKLNKTTALEALKAAVRK